MDEFPGEALDHDHPSRAGSKGQRRGFRQLLEGLFQLQAVLARQGEAGEVEDHPGNAGGADRPEDLVGFSASDRSN